MKPVVDIIEGVVDLMRPTDNVVVASGTSPYTVSGLNYTYHLFVGQQLKFVGTLPSVTAYVTVASIVSNTQITVTSSVELTSGKGNTGTLVPVLNYHHGHLIEIRNTFKLATQKGTVKKSMFPAIILVQDFPEAVKERNVQREATLRLFILTDSQQKYTADERYINTFIPILYPLEDRFFEALENAPYIHSIGDYTRHDRLFWGRTENAEGTATNIFNDFIDAIEIENLKITTANC